MPAGQAIIPNPSEVPDYVWLSPAEAVERAADKSLAIPIPTLSMLQGLAEVPGYEQLMGGTRRAREVEAFEHSPLVTSVLAPNPGLMSGAGTNTYLVGRGEVAIIDPAVADAVYIERVVREAGNRGRAVLALITHMHIDHIGGVAPLTEQMPMEVAAFGEAPYVTRRLADGDEITVGGATLRALHTPGHASDHLCFELVEEDAIFTGDVVAGFGTVVIAPPDGNMADYMRTLQRLSARRARTMYPAHGPVVGDPAAKLDEYIAHRRDRERQVVDALAAGIAELPNMVERIYAEVPKALHPMAERSLLAHLEMLETEGRAVRDGETWRLS
jgi:glyoxylase-like metal-dependent hydrolase (beta-lactamase superfamily II)